MYESGLFFQLMLVSQCTSLFPMARWRKCCPIYPEEPPRIDRSWLEPDGREIYLWQKLREDLNQHFLQGFYRDFMDNYKNHLLKLLSNLIA